MSQCECGHDIAHHEGLVGTCTIPICGCNRYREKPQPEVLDVVQILKDIRDNTEAIYNEVRNMRERMNW